MGNPIERSIIGIVVKSNMEQWSIAATLNMRAAKLLSRYFENQLLEKFHIHELNGFGAQHLDDRFSNFQFQELSVNRSMVTPMFGYKSVRHSIS